MHSVPTRRRSLTAAILLTAAALCGGACSSSAPKTVTHGDIQSEPTPELWGLGSRHVDYQNNYHYSWAHNRRAFWDDWNMAWLGERPSYLHKGPSPY